MPLFPERLSRQQRRAHARAEKKAQRRNSRAGLLATVGALLAAAPATAATFTVTNLNDALAGSLRDAVTQANTTPGPDLVVFQSGLTGTITLTSGEIPITDSVTIDGGAAALTVSGNNSSRIFNVEYAGSDTPIDVQISHLTLTQGTGSYGGAIRSYDENLTLDHVTITGNGGFVGGGVYFDGDHGASLTVTQCNITGNDSYGGGGIAISYATGPVNLSSDQISNNTAYIVGGGIAAQLYAGGSMNVTNCIISGNQAGGPGGPSALGGGMAVNADAADGATTPLNIVDSTISGNIASTGTEGEGGGLYISYLVGAVISQSTISGNQAFVGGGIEFEYAGTYVLPLRIENTTIVNNTAADAGGGVYACAYSYSTIAETTIAGNTADLEGGGIDFVHATTSDVRNSIIANNTCTSGTTPDVNTELGTTVTANYTLIEVPGGATIGGGTGNVTGVDPQLGALLPFSGSPTNVERPACASPAINAGDLAFVAPPATDQRHLPRLGGGRIDMGAVEYQPSTVQLTVTAASVAENAGSITLTASRAGFDGPINANFATADGSAKGTASGIGTPDYTPASGTLSWGDLDTANKTFSVPILNDAVFEGNEAFTASLASPGCGATIGANGTETVTIVDDEVPLADLSVTKAAVGTLFIATQTVMYNITVSNAGPNVSPAVTVTDVLPAGTTFVSATASQGSCSGTTTVTCNLGTINNAGTATIALRVTLNNSGPYTNTATVSSATADSNPGNNSGSASINAISAAQVPTLSEKMLMLLVAMFGAIGAWFAGKK